jgi:hypothetical protein
MLFRSIPFLTLFFRFSLPIMEAPVSVKTDLPFVARAVPIALVIMLLAGATGTVTAQSAPDCNNVTYADSDGDGSLDVSTVAHLQCIESNGVKDDYELTSDIDASATSSWNGGDGFEPIGDNRNPESFGGTFNGNGHKITGLTIDRASAARVGLFDHVRDGTVKNVTLLEVDISGDTRVGGVVGFAEGADLQGLAVTGTITASSSVGGIVGVLYNIEGSITEDPVPSTLSESYVGGSITGRNVGGIAGQNRGAIEAVYTTATVGDDSKVGGIVGLNGNEGVVRDAYAAGEITGTEYVGGIVGQSGGQVTDSYWDTEETNQQDPIGLGSSGANVEGLTTSEMKGTAAEGNMGESNMGGFDFSTTWGVVQSSGVSYPYLQNNKQTPEPGLVLDLALQDGSSNQLDFSAQVTPGTDNNPIGILSLEAGRTGATVDGLTVTNNSPGVEGIDQARLVWSTDQTLGGDTELDVISVDPSGAPQTFSFGGFRQDIPTSPGYLIVAIDVTGEATASGIQFTLEAPEDLSLTNGTAATVNGSDQNSISSLPLANGTTALPVELASMSATNSAEGEMALRWNTASETDNAGFEVQRRIDGALSSGDGWKKVGYRESKASGGTTSEPHTYQFTDGQVPYTADSVSYRLKQVDLDGTTRLTDPVTVRRSGPEQVELADTAPNPVRQRTTIRYAVPEGTSGPITLRLYDVMGRQVRTVDARAEAGRHEQTLDVSGLASGVYVLRLTAGGAAKTRKLTIVR